MLRIDSFWLMGEGHFHRTGLRKGAEWARYHEATMPISESGVLDALRSVIDPDLHRDIVSLGFVKDVHIEGGHVAFKVELTTPACPVKDQLKSQAEQAVLGLEGVQAVDVTMTARVMGRQPGGEDLLPSVKHVIAVASGKGGVGKSTVSVNLAVALAQTGAKVGLMDADVYGPSIPVMLGCEDERPEAENQKILPIVRHGIRLMSLGFLMEVGQAVLWRGPMVAGTVKQLLADVEWGELDYLLVDLPPGTGDAPMTLAQQAPLTGVVIVATPQHVAASIAAKSIELFRKLNAPILGIVENMAGFVCPNCGTVTPIFAGLAGEELAQHYGVPYLGSIPLDPAVSACSDAGVPSLVEFAESPHSKAFREIAGKIAAQASIKSHTDAATTQFEKA